MGARDATHYYLARANALEDNVRLYVVNEGSRIPLGSTTVDPPARNSWHVLEIVARGDALRATLDGRWTVEGKDASYARGWCGVWTKADSTTDFDDLQVDAAPAEPAPPGMQ